MRTCLRLGGLALILSASVMAAPKTVLALGDSITAGGRPTSCYREYLAPALKKHGVSFIGPQQDTFSAHAGYGGRNSGFLREKIEEIYRAHPADLVLIHSGHNHFAKDRPVPEIIADTRAMIRSILRINPNAVILVAQVIPSGKLPKYSYIPELNRELGALAKRLNGNPGRIIAVDQAEGFDWKTDTFEDHVHPNPAGAKKMAERWMEALEPLLVATRTDP